MRKIFLLSSMLIVASLLLVSCGDPGAGNAGNRPANAANNATATAPAANAAAVETEIKKLANDMSAAMVKGDTAAMDKAWAENYMFIGPDGAVATKAQRIDSMKSGDSKIESLAYDEMSVRLNPEGTGAILIGRVTVKGVNLGKPVDGQFRMTQVWSKTKDGWRLATGQVTPITAAAAPAKADDKKAEGDKPAAANAAKPPPPPPANK